MAIVINSINVKFPMVKGTAGSFETNKTTLDAIKDNLKILILSNYGERPIHFDFGANLREILFDQGSDLGEKVRDRIVAAINKWMPFVTLTGFIFESNSTNSNIPNNQVNISLEFLVGQIKGKLDLPIKI